MEGTEAQRWAYVHFVLGVCSPQTPLGHPETPDGRVLGVDVCMHTVSAPEGLVSGERGWARE